MKIIDDNLENNAKPMSSSKISGFAFARPDEPQAITESHCLHYIEYLISCFPNAILNSGELLSDTSAQTKKQICQISQLLVSLGISDEALYAAILAYLRIDGLDEKILSKHFQTSFISVYQRILTMDSLSVLGRAYEDVDENSDSEKLRLENLRRMLLTMVDDVRVVIIKLAEQVILLRNLAMYKQDHRDIIASESLEVYAPLANRLGVWQLKWELEDLAFRHQSPKEYKKLSGQISEKRVSREQYIKSFIHELKARLKSENITAEVEGRPKHLYSIWRKMRKKNLAFESVFDLRAVRILVDNVAQCYASLGVVHTCYPNVQGEFDDYIAVPKENGYRSIHTAIYGPKGNVIEVQIRTHEMHNENEFGVAAHWRYKEGSGSDKSSKPIENKILWLRHLLDWKSELNSANQIIDQFKHDVDDERVYVFSPKGEVIDLRAGSTAIDFAYAIHTEVGNRCRGAKINGRIIQLTKALNTGDQVEILTVKKGGPSRDWLNPALGFVKTAKARHCILRWFKEEDRDVNIADGRHIMDKEIAKMAANDVKFDSIAAKLKFKHNDDMYVALANGELKVTQVANAVKALQDEAKLKQAPAVSSVANTEEDKTGSIAIKRRRVPKKSSSGVRNDVEVTGVGNMLITIAKCCHPLPGDSITGYITQLKGVSIHRSDCDNILKVVQKNNYRLVDVQWIQPDSSISGDTKYDVQILLRAYDRQGLLLDVTTVINNEKISLNNLSTFTDKTKNEAQMSISIEVNDYSSLSKLLSRLEQIRNVIEAKRIAN